MDLPTAVRIFFKKTVAEGGIPFDMKVSKQYASNSGVELLTQIRQEAQDNGVTDMTLDDINAEIQAYRNEKRNN